MKKVLITLILATMFLCGCSAEAEKENLEEQCQILRDEIEILETEKSNLESVIIDTKVEKGLEKYIVVLNIKQSHFTLDISTHLKDEMNDLDLPIMVDKEYYDSVEIGTVVDDSFRAGSFWMEGSIGNWEITVKDKYIE